MVLCAFLLLQRRGYLEGFGLRSARRWREIKGKYFMPLLGFSARGAEPVTSSIDWLTCTECSPVCSVVGCFTTRTCWPLDGIVEAVLSQACGGERKRKSVFSQ